MSGINQNYIIIADAEDADKVTKLYKGMDKAIVSFSIEAKLALERRGVECIFPDDLVDLPDLNKLGSDNLQLVKDICEIIDNKLKERFPFLQQNRINLFGNGFFVVKVFFDSLCSSFLILERLFQEIGNRDVVLYSSGCALENIAERNCALVPSLIKYVFLKEYPAIKIIPESNYRSSRIMMEDVRSYFPLLVLCMQTWFRKNSRTVCGSKGIVLDSRYDVKILIDDVLREMEFFEIFLFRRIIAIKSLHSRRLSIKMLSDNAGVYKVIREIFHEITAEMATHEIFHGHAGLGSFAFLYLEQYLTKSLGGILHHGDDIKSVLSEIAPTLLCTASCRIDLKDAFVLGIAKSLDVPVVTYQEGGGAGYLDWPLFNLDTKLSNFFLVYGKGVAESPYIEKKLAKVIPVGSIYLDQVKKNMSATKKGTSLPGIYVILDNIKTDVWQHYPCNGGNFSQAYRHQSKIIESLKKVDFEGFILKTIKGRENLYSSMIDIKDHIRIETKPLSSILHNASAFVLEYPSTVLQECLLTNKPIALLFNKTSVIFDNYAFELLKRRVRVVSEYEEFTRVLESLIEDVRLGNPMTENKDFLMNYCLMENSKGNIDNFFSSIRYKKVHRGEKK
jgi:hypothetical protein